jgi:hypothetical protein
MNVRSITGNMNTIVWGREGSCDSFRNCTWLGQITPRLLNLLFQTANQLNGEANLSV